MTIYFLKGLKKQQEGYIYMQLYSKEQALFNVAKLTPFVNKSYKYLIVNLSLVNTISYTRKAVVFNLKAYKYSYLYSKKQANHITIEAQYKLSGT